MKNLMMMLGFVGMSFVVLGCKSEAQKKDVVEATYSLEKASNAITWTAYKTTEKIPVKGKFTQVDIISGGTGNTIKEAINGTEFSVPISSIFTSDTSRDYKIKNFFFGVMNNTELLTGTLHIENDSIGYTNLTMNGISKKLPFQYTVVDKTFSMSTTMDVLNWNAENAINSLNNVCLELHKGLDGVSKTWAEVAINVSSTFR